MTAPQPQPIITHAAVKSAAEADALVHHFTDVMDQLIGIVQQETELVRAGRLGAATKLAQAKGDLSHLYIADTLRLRASQSYLTKTQPGTVAFLRERHDSFRALLQINLTVLATAHAVSEGIVRGVSDEMVR